MIQKENIEQRKCKFCDAPLKHRFVDVVLQAIGDCQMNLSDGGPPFELLPTYVCSQCFLVQVESVTSTIPEHIYFSSFSSSWLSDLKQYTDQVFERLEISSQSLVVELMSRQENRVKKEVFQFGNERVRQLMDIYGKADLLICKDELAYVHDINDFISAASLFLKPSGVITMEFLHLLLLMEGAQFDVPCFDHFNYFSFTTLERIFAHHGLVIYDVEKFSSHGLLRIYAKHQNDGTKRVSGQVPLLRQKEYQAGVTSLVYYDDFKNKAVTHRTPFSFSVGESWNNN